MINTLLESGNGLEHLVVNHTPGFRPTPSLKNKWNYARRVLKDLARLNSGQFNNPDSPIHRDALHTLLVEVSNTEDPREAETLAQTVLQPREGKGAQTERERGYNTLGNVSDLGHLKQTIALVRENPIKQGWLVVGNTLRVGTFAYRCVGNDERRPIPQAALDFQWEEGIGLNATSTRRWDCDRVERMEVLRTPDGQLVREFVCVEQAPQPHTYTGWHQTEGGLFVGRWRGNPEGSIKEGFRGLRLRVEQDRFSRD